ncbi:DUF5330 domain-containing protein [Pararhizobium antarcticum]|uniref:DUF5330 domain-containing protein n=1 Tax=Pararhizobium antarcticum TaxID=1798805 RepID=A0A657LS40_9HYPH|nr:DUF5330 domain-containing protein [Pararhizobium antarcticum]OJF95905.1 hypothetical protein AX760_18775 [Pararhizobium antarcticum]OJF99350.1 hypothetical protein AX761_11410 [Rhizobium sp. 58]
MWFLIKGTFWFSMVLVLLPFLDPASTTTLERGPKVDVGDTFSAATEAFGYISALCIQKPDVCEKGGETFVALGHRAREGARIAYQFLDQQFASPDDAVMTGTIAADTAPATLADPNDTLAVDAEGDTVPMFGKTPVPEPRIEPRTAQK